jgi:hypothetical protein
MAKKGHSQQSRVLAKLIGELTAGGIEGKLWTLMGATLLLRTLFPFVEQKLRISPEVLLLSHACFQSLRVG